MKDYSNEEKILENEIKNSLNHKDSTTIVLNVSSYLAFVCTLRKFVYNHKYKDKNISFRFLDNSISSVFPLGCLQLDKFSEVPNEAISMRLGLMSMYYPQLDYLVDCYITQSGEFSPHSSSSDMEKRAYLQTLNILENSHLKAGGVVALFHTKGIEPIVLGYCRGISKVIQDRIKLQQPRSLFFIFKQVDSISKMTDANSVYEETPFIINSDTIRAKELYWN